MEDAKYFLLSSCLGPTPSPPQLIQPQWLPLSFSLTHIHVCLELEEIYINSLAGVPYSDLQCAYDMN